MRSTSVSARIDLDELDELLSRSSLADASGESRPQSVDASTTDPASTIRELAARGQLAAVVSTMDAPCRRQLTMAAYQIAFPIVFQRLTRTIEVRRGHMRCMQSITNLEPACLDRFHDDVEAVIDDLFSHARQPIHNIEGWVTSRLAAVTANAHRARRGRVGAMQRPRLPAWLTERLRSDPWLRRLALELLTWVGVSGAKGDEVWPIDRWINLRQSITGDWASDRNTVRRDLDAVLEVMRTRPRWYELYVERPLERKPIPVATQEPDLDDVRPDTLALKNADETDQRLVALAEAALDEMTASIESGAPAAAAVRRTLAGLLTAEPSSVVLGRRPCDTMVQDAHVLALVADEHKMDALVRRVLPIVTWAIPPRGSRSAERDRTVPLSM